MKIDRFKITSRFKNIEGVTVDFDESNLMTVLVGGNGSGKSNVIEALVLIFKALDLGESPPFSYQIAYRLGTGGNTRNIKVKADLRLGTMPDKQYDIECQQGAEDSVRLRISAVKRSKSGEAFYLPNHVFAYYSGPSDRLERHFRSHRTKFYKQLLDRDADLKGKIRPLFYAKPIHSQFVLLAFYLTDDDVCRNFLNEHLGIESLDSIHFILRRPSWAKSSDRNERFWGAQGVVREFLDVLFPHAIAPLKLTRLEDTTLTGSNIRNEFFHLLLPDLASLQAFASKLGADVFFKMLESTLLSEVLSEVSIRVKSRWSDKPLSFSELSEGQQQLLTVLGLLRFTGGKDTLFLLDEPDTHLNPAWAVKYLDWLKRFTPDHESSHLLMVSHHPLAIAELEKEQIQVMTIIESANGFRTIARMPEKSPRGLGYSGILMSDMFNLRSDVDQHTLRRMHRRAVLAAQEQITDVELEELNSLNHYLDHLGYASFDSDPYFRDFLKRYDIKNVVVSEPS